MMVEDFGRKIKVIGDKTADRIIAHRNANRSAPLCHFCNDTGSIAIRSSDGAYAFAGPVPDDAKGYADADCWYCDCARSPKAGAGRCRRPDTCDGYCSLEPPCGE